MKNKKLVYDILFLLSMLILMSGFVDRSGLKMIIGWILVFYFAIKSFKAND